MRNSLTKSMASSAALLLRRWEDGVVRLVQGAAACRLRRQGATGELNVVNLAKVKVFVQAKHYKLGSKVSASTVKQLRQAIPFGGQGAFITTADFQGAAADVALEPGFPRIGLVNGRQLVDLLVEHWGDIPPEFRELLGLKPGLVRA